MTSRLSSFATALCAALVLSACASWPERPVVTVQDQAAAQVSGFSQIRVWDDAEATTWRSWRNAMIQKREEAGQTGRIEMLAISSGSDKGAFTAGFLKGWSQAGTRPEFDVVSGVSTGALIAPFAFLGSDYDPALEQLYTQINADTVYSIKPFDGLFGGPALASTKPLQKLIESYADTDLIDAIAREHRRGRRLLVQTTNLDAERGVVWDMGAIAASHNPDRYRLFRDVLRASSAIPGFFTPVLIEVSTPERTFSELHVDGGTTSSLHAIAPSVLFEDMPNRSDGEGRVTILYNGALEPIYRVSQPNVLAILERALTVSIKTADQRAIDALKAFSRETGLVVEIHEVGEVAEDPDVSMFDQEFMRSLFAMGLERGRKQP